MRLAWNEIRHRATRFAQEWKDAHYEKGETQTFYNEFFEIFGIQRRKVATFEEPIKRAGAIIPAPGSFTSSAFSVPPNKPSKTASKISRVPPKKQPLALGAAASRF